MCVIPFQWAPQLKYVSASVGCVTHGGHYDHNVLNHCNQNSVTTMNKYMCKYYNLKACDLWQTDNQVHMQSPVIGTTVKGKEEGRE